MRNSRNTQKEEDESFFKVIKTQVVSTTPIAHFSLAWINRVKTLRGKSSVNIWCDLGLPFAGRLYLTWLLSCYVNKWCWCLPLLACCLFCKHPTPSLLQTSPCLTSCTLALGNIVSNYVHTLQDTEKKKPPCRTISFPGSHCFSFSTDG